MNELFSPNENRILKIIGNRQMSILEITEKLYKDVTYRDMPFGANNYVGSVVRRINAKCEHHDLKWFLNSAGSGRCGKTVWRDKR